MCYLSLSSFNFLDRILAGGVLRDREVSVHGEALFLLLINKLHFLLCLLAHSSFHLSVRIIFFTITVAGDDTGTTNTRIIDIATAFFIQTLQVAKARPVPQFQGVQAQSISAPLDILNAADEDYTARKN